MELEDAQDRGLTAVLGGHYNQYLVERMQRAAADWDPSCSVFLEWAWAATEAFFLSAKVRCVSTTTTLTHKRVAACRCAESGRGFTPGRRGANSTHSLAAGHSLKAGQLVFQSTAARCISSTRYRLKRPPNAAGKPRLLVTIFRFHRRVELQQGLGVAGDQPPTESENDGQEPSLIAGISGPSPPWPAASAR